jgi:myo-inositol-1(or 4)-monophosphatase
MQSTIDWLPILLQCKENVLAHEKPLLKKTREPQPDLGVGAGGDQTKLIDLVAEKAIVEVLLQRGISFTLVSEEAGIKQFGDNPQSCYVTIDPIDGSANMSRGLPFYCTSIAVSTKPMLSDVHTALLSDLVHGYTYLAQAGKGATCNGEKIVPSKVVSLDQAMIGIDMNICKFKTLECRLEELIEKTKHNRHFGANALELCFVAEGLTDAFVDLRGRLRTTDLAAAYLIIKEAGAIMTDADGKSVDAKLDPKQTVKFVASGNPQIHQTILELIKQKKQTHV